GRRGYRRRRKGHRGPAGLARRSHGQVLSCLSARPIRQQDLCGASRLNAPRLSPPPFPGRSVESRLGAPEPLRVHAYGLCLDLFRVTASRTRAFNAAPSIFSPSWKSMARLVFPSRLALKRPEGSFRAAPLAKVIFTTFLYVSPVQISPSCDHTGTPLHFHSSTTSGSASLTRVRSRLSILPRQSPSSSIRASID